MAGMNQRRRKEAQAKREANAERNRLHPAIPSSRDRLSVSSAHADALMQASHNVGFMGQGRTVANPTRVIERKGNVDKSRFTMDGSAPMYGKTLPVWEDYRPTAPKSARFREDDYPNNEPKRTPVKVEKRERVLNPKTGRMNWGKFKKAALVTAYDAPYHPGKLNKREV